MWYRVPLAGSGPEPESVALCLKVRRFTPLCSPDSGVNNYLAIGSEIFCRIVNAIRPTDCTVRLDGVSE